MAVKPAAVPPRLTKEVVTNPVYPCRFQTAATLRSRHSGRDIGEYGKNTH